MLILRLCIINYFVDTSIGNGTEKVPYKQQITNYITLQCNKNGIPVDLGLATAYQESSYQQNVWSRKDNNWEINESGGGYGLMQIQKVYHEEAFSGGNLGIDVVNNWHDNVDYGISYLAKCYNEAKGLGYSGDDLLKATYSDYNSGSCSMYKRSNQVAYDVKCFLDKYNRVDELCY